MTDTVTDIGTLFCIIEIAFAARTFYGFCRTYFRHKYRLNESSNLVEDIGKIKSKQRTITATQETSNVVTKKKKPVRVYMDGCFDAMHFGHANALRQAKALGDILVVGINPEYEIRKHKGPPVMSDEERRVAVSSVTWVDEVLTDVPYVVTPEFLKTLIVKHNIGIIVHGDDPCTGADGQDVYGAVKDMGRFRTVKRTEGVSSTDIVGRILLCTRDHHMDALKSSTSSSHVREEANGVSEDSNHVENSAPVSNHRPYSRISSFLPTTRRLIQFAGETRAPKPGDRVVYCDGAFDMFHAGHIKLFKKAREQGDFLLVGIHDDATVNATKGSNYPIMHVHERTLAVLSCRYVDEVIIGAPRAVTEDMIKTMNISCVVHGKSKRYTKGEDPYAVPRRMDILREVDSGSELRVGKILHRVTKQREQFVKRNMKKEQSEKEYFTNHKTYVEEG